MPSDLPRLALSMGDPAGIGPEVILKALADPDLAAQITVVGHRRCFEQTYGQLQTAQNPSRPAPLLHPDDLNLLEVESFAVESAAPPMVLGQPTAATGQLSFDCLNQAISLALDHQVAGVVTGPIAKAAWSLAGHRYPGQTELLAERAGVTRFGMMFVATSPHSHWQLRTLLATTHIPLQSVPQQITPEGLTQKLALLIETLHQDFGLSRPKIAIAGLNPHSGEQGQLGQEEVQWMEDWLRAMGQQFPQVTLTGLIPPDTMWVAPGQAWYGQSRGFEGTLHDAYLALYHDQGLIPVKLMAFDRAVNTTLGLPFIRTSPDHGTAFDIAGKGIANPQSMKAALELAIAQAHRRAAVHLGAG
ncbi:4-hydroxythreonine-4-phosphate dehydrogenase PdxA [Lyngbya confervoides]|uniref:4-hydroxythreonine-4-phosphate dehydrogenase n=1 Tax=Lyngbya confervoides BDU141951 TaxID=1574623 RepID=A0ABD4T4W9_9CYAN|nr:4-hydroxythreonine-4-phosphate dehydrogenase PdxA [Lyngbya confervoides]MCM1983615.1 4-hydroxythreonine-4-phosphate dehydrogenase PdxA [Lyngbya confervoides BDU141951]